jgi:hypothetical protein
MSFSRKMRLPALFAFAIVAPLLAITPTTPAAAQNLSGLSCTELWLKRNDIYAEFKYCFKSQRGKVHIGNEGCFRNESEARTAMGAGNRRRVNKIKAAERRKGC